MEKPIGIKYVEAIKAIISDFAGSIAGNTEDELVISWNGIAEISKADIQAKITEMETAEADAKAGFGQTIFPEAPPPPLDDVPSVLPEIPTPESFPMGTVGLSTEGLDLVNVQTAIRNLRRANRL